MKGTAKPLAQRFAKRGVGKRAFAPQPVFHVRGAHGEAVRFPQLHGGQQKGNGIRAAAEGDQNRCLRA